MIRKMAIGILAVGMTCNAVAQRPKVGLVFGGGGARGAAQVGALKVIEEAGIPIDYVVGTSIGAIVGGLYAAGYHADQLETMFCQQQWLSLLTDRKEQYGGDVYRVEKGVTYIFGFPILDKNNTAFGILRGGKVEQTIDSMLAVNNCVEFENLKTPFACVAAEMMTAREVVLDKGTLPQAIRASMAIPGIFKPVKIDGRQLVDGGMLNNLPVDVAKRMGADIVIAIDLQQGEPEKPEQKENPLQSITDMLGVSALANWALQRPDQQKYFENRQKADIYVNPDLIDYDISSFGNNNMAQMIAIGQKAMRQHWQQLMELKASTSGQ